MSQLEQFGDPPPMAVDPATPEEIADALPVITVTTEPGRTVVRLAGDIDLAASVELDGAARVVAERTVPAEVDLSQVTFMDSIGVGFIARLLMAGRQHGWQPRLLGPGRQVVDTLTISGLIDSVDLVD